MKDVKDFIKQLPVWYWDGKEFFYISNLLLLLLLIAVRWDLTPILMLCFYVSLLLLLKAIMTAIAVLGLKMVWNSVQLHELFCFMVFLLIYGGFLHVVGHITVMF